MYNNFSNYLGARRCDNKCQGIIGPQGSQGKGGPIGPYGSTGAQGPTGSQGATGIGCRGATGAQGAQGPAGGAQGVTGAQGAQGFQGVTGQQGSIGSQGVTGSQGFQGVTGQQGFQGVTGQQGLQGVTGQQGFQGVTGSQGFQGVTGQQGFQGVTGSQGFQGVTGAQGDIGPGGSLGYYASFGSTANQGITGIGLTSYFNNLYVDGAGNNQVTISGANNDTVIISNPGTYNIQFSAQFEGPNNEDIFIWLEENNITVPNSNTRLHTSGGGSPQVAAWNWFITTTTINQTFRIAWTATNTSVLIYSAVNTYGPTIPPVILTVQQVMNTQLGATGAQGNTGAQGSTGAQGVTGQQGNTGAQGASQWTNMNGIGPQGAGYTGIGITGQDVLIYGNMLLTGVLDPTAIYVNASVPNQSTSIFDGTAILNMGTTGGVSNPQLVLNQNNTSSGSANMVFRKNISTNGSAIGEMTFIAKTAISGNPEREYARIGATIRSNTSSNVDGAINFQARINDTLTELMRINGQDAHIEIYQPLDLNDKDIVSSTGNIELNATASTGTGDILLTPKTTGYVRVSEDILTDSKITTLTNFPASTGSYVDFASNGDDDNFRIDKTSLTFTQNYSAPVDIASSITLLNDATAGTNSIALSQTDTTLPSGSKTTTIVNQQLVQTITMNDTITNKSITLDNSFSANDNRLSFSVDDGSSTYSSKIINNDTIQQLSFSKVSGLAGKTLQFNNLSQGEIFFINTLDTNPLVIESNQDLNINSTKAGGFINMTSTSSINITATGDNLALTAGATMLLDSDDLQFTNSNITTSTPNNTSSLATTSNIGDITNYLKVKLNGADIWIPYFTTDPSI